MKYIVNDYVKAFIQTINKVGHVGALFNFVKLLKKTGDIKHSKKILEAIHKNLINEKGGKWVEVEVARESALDEKFLKNKFSKKDHVGFKISPELVAGVRITVDGEEELNNSLQNKLNKLFK